MELHGHTVRGVDVGPETRCRHYDSELDVIAIRFPCCESFYPCYECHLAVADHEPAQWGAEDDGSAAQGGAEDDGSTDRTGAEDDGSANRTGAEDDELPNRSDGDVGDVPAVLCGICGSVLTIAAYLDSSDRCPACGAEFNPGCRRHYDRYFGDALFGKK